MALFLCSGSNNFDAREIVTLRSVVSSSFGLVFTAVTFIIFCIIGHSDLCLKSFLLHVASQLLSLKCQIVVLGRPIPGTLVFTSSLLTFTVDDSTEEYSKEAYLVSYISLIQWLLEFYECIHTYR